MKPDQPKPCECGCGQPAPIAKKTNTRQGMRKGEPQRFVHGHAARVFPAETRRRIGNTQRGRTVSLEQRRKLSEALRGRTFSPETRRKMSQAQAGPRKPLSPEHRRNISLAQGGTGEASVLTIHQRLAHDYPKKRVCEECGKEGKTAYAFKYHPEPHTRAREDYRELCTGCHNRFDAQLRATRRTSGRSRDGAE